MQHNGPIDPRTLSRRMVLGLGLLTLVGCSHSHPVSPRSPAPNPDAAALARARDGELLLVSSYDAAIRRAPRRQQPALRVARALHAAHLAVLRPLASPSHGAIAPLDDLPGALRSSAASLEQAAAGAQAGSTAALLASIAASHSASAR